MVVVDNSKKSGVEIDVTLWGELAKVEVEEGRAVALKGVRVVEKRGKTLTASFDAEVLTDLHSISAQAAKLEAWFRDFKASGKPAIKLTEQGSNEPSKPALEVSIEEMNSITASDRFKALDTKESEFFKIYFKFQRIFRPS